MRALPSLFLTVIMMSSLHAAEHELQITTTDTFVVKDTEEWTVAIRRYLFWNYADVAVHPKEGKSFSLMLYFKSDLVRSKQGFDTPLKMRKLVADSSDRYLGISEDETIEVDEIANKGWYGFKTTITNANLAGKPIPPGKFLHITRGMIRLSQHAALGFSLMTNDLESGETQKIMDYIYGFAKEKNP